MAIQTYELAYQVSPIVLTGGIALSAPGSMMPFLAFANSAIFAGLQAAASANTGLNSLDDAFGAFQVIPGGSLIENTIGHYPFVNQYVAANAIIREPLHISLIWDTPMRGIGAWAVKLATMQALKATLDSHNNAGGTYTVITPAYVYDNLVMNNLVDNSRGDASLPQNAWRFDFERPLIVMQELASALSQLMNQLTNGTPTDGSWSGISPSVGASATQPQSSPGATSTLPGVSSAGTVAGIPGTGQAITAVTSGGIPLLI
jgi:hypothetical protein